MLTGKIEIAKLIPHAGVMCLLDEVIHCDETSIRCSSRSHRHSQNPLRSDGRLATIAAIEYAAQAMALHGALARRVSGKPAAGYLASLRDVRYALPFLDLLEGELTIDAELLIAEKTRVIYSFAITIGATEAITGRAGVVLEVASVLSR